MNNNLVSILSVLSNYIAASRTIFCRLTERFRNGCAQNILFCLLKFYFSMCYNYTQIDVMYFNNNTPQLMVVQSKNNHIHRNTSVANTMRTEDDIHLLLNCVSRILCAWASRKLHWCEAQNLQTKHSTFKTYDRAPIHTHLALVVNVFTSFALGLCVCAMFVYIKSGSGRLRQSKPIKFHFY